MWPDVSKAEAKIGGRWVPVEGIIQKRREIRNAAVEVAGAEAGSTTATTTAAWGQWVSEALVPAVRNRWAEPRSENGAIFSNYNSRRL